MRQAVSRDLMEPDWTAVPRFGTPPPGTCVVVRPSAYALVTDGRGWLAVVRTPRGLYLPGGGLEPGERAADAAAREAREECGLVVRVGEWATRAVEFVHAVAEGTHYEKRCTFIDARVRGPAVRAAEPDHALVWLPPGEAAARLSAAGHRWAVTVWLGRSRARV